MESKELEDILNIFHDECLTKHGVKPVMIGSGFPGCQVEVSYALTEISKFVTAEVEMAKAEAYDDAKYWLEDRLTSKKDVADICSTRAAVYRKEIDPSKSKFIQLQEDPRG